MKKDQLYVSDYVVPLNRFGKIGKIHSIFDRSFNIEVEAQLISIASYQEYLSSYGIYVPEQLFRELQSFIQLGNVVNLSNSDLLIYSDAGTKKLDLKKAELVSLHISPIPLQKDTIHRLIDEIEKKNIQDFIGLDLGETEERVFSQMKEGVSSEEWKEITAYLVGRGKGLTPSGDDVLLAYLFVMKLFKPELTIEFSKVLTQKNLSTTTISKNYIEALLCDTVSLPIYRLFNAIKNNETDERLAAAVDQLLLIGHTSGKDMCFGLLLGLYAVSA